MIILPASPSNPDNPRLGWHNLVTFGGITATSAAATFPASNMANGTTFLAWKAADTAGQDIVIDLGASRLVDYVGIARHNFGTAGIYYTLAGSSNGEDWTNLADSVAPPDDGVVLHQFEAATIRYVRVQLSSGSAPAQVAVLHVGLLLVMERRLYVGHVPAGMGRESNISTGFSESGQFLGRVRRRQFFSGKIDLANLDPAWYRLYVQPFAEVADVQAFFWAWRPQAYPNEVLYAWATDDLAPVNQRANGMMQLSFSFQGIRA